MTAHSKIGASSAYRWMACPGSVRESKGLPNTTSWAAAEGTVAHYVAEQCLNTGLDPSEFEGQVIVEEGHSIEVDEEMVGYVNGYLDYVASVMALDKDAVLHVEASFHLKRLHKDAFGTADACVWLPNLHKLYVIDLKYGKGKFVEVVENPQGKYYACGALLELDYPADDVVVAIYQPRVPGAEAAREWATSAMDLIEWMADLEAAMLATEDPKAPLAAGSHCDFCPAAGKPCPALAQLAQDTAKREFVDDPSDPDVSAYDPELLADTLEKLPVIVRWCKSVQEFADNQAMRGKTPPRHKLVAGKGAREWTAADQVPDALEMLGFERDVAFTEPKLKSVAQVEKAVGKNGKKALETLWEKKEGSPKLVHESDKRPPIAAPAYSDFEATE